MVNKLNSNECPLCKLGYPKIMSIYVTIDGKEVMLHLPEASYNKLIKDIERKKEEYEHRSILRKL